MRNILISALLLVGMFSAPAIHAQADDREEQHQKNFQDAVDAAIAERAAKKTTELQFAKATLKLLQQYVPDQYEVLTMAEYRVLLATKLQKKKISEEEYNYLWAERRNEFAAKKKKEEDQAIARAEDEKLRRNMEIDAANRRREDQMMRQQAYNDEIDRQQRIQANGALLQGIGNAFTRTYQKPSVNCTSLPVGASVSTTCY